MFVGVGVSHNPPRSEKCHKYCYLLILFICVIARKQIMLWEKKIQLKEEARSEFDKQNDELQKLKIDVQNKEVTWFSWFWVVFCFFY